MRRRKILSNPNVLPFQAGPVDKNPFMWRNTPASPKNDRVQPEAFRQRMRPDSPFSSMLSGMDIAADQAYLSQFSALAPQPPVQKLPEPIPGGPGKMPDFDGDPVRFFQKGFALGQKKR